MADTYSQISIHIVFAVKKRQNFITQNFRDDLHRYIAGIVETKNQKSLAVNGWLDHVHIFFGMEPSVCISDFVRDIKSNSSKWMNENDFLKTKFEWQHGYGTFSHSKSQRDSVIKYIINQEQHHRTETFHQEYFKMLQKAEIEFEEKYLFEFYDDGKIFE